jgi:hypothetical protein
MGGGGAGGASIGILSSSVGWQRVGSTNFYSIGPGGAGGFAPNPGATGISATVYGVGVDYTPHIDSVIPPKGVPGDTVTIYGAHFDPIVQNNSVIFGIGEATVIRASADSLAVLVPANGTTCHIKATTTFLETYSPNVFAFCAAAKGDLNASGGLSPADVVMMLNCVFLGTGNCGNCFTDVNCSGDFSPADVVLELNAVFLGASFPC